MSIVPARFRRQESGISTSHCNATRVSPPRNSRLAHNEVWDLEWDYYFPVGRRRTELGLEAQESVRVNGVCTLGPSLALLRDPPGQPHWILNHRSQRPMLCENQSASSGGA